MADVVTFGEAMIRLSPPDFNRLEQTSTLDMKVGGAEFNVAIGLARLGVSSAFVTRVPTNPLGRMIVNKTREHGVGLLSRRLVQRRPRGESISWNSEPHPGPPASSTTEKIPLSQKSPKARSTGTRRSRKPRYSTPAALPPPCRQPLARRFSKRSPKPKSIMSKSVST